MALHITLNVVRTDYVLKGIFSNPEGLEFIVKFSFSVRLILKKEDDGDIIDADDGVFLFERSNVWS